MKDTTPLRLVCFAVWIPLSGSMHAVAAQQPSLADSVALARAIAPRALIDARRTSRNS